MPNAKKRAVVERRKTSGLGKGESGNMARWKRHPIGGRFCWWSAARTWRGRPRVLAIHPFPQGAVCTPARPVEWRVDYGHGVTLWGTAGSVFAAMRLAEFRAMRARYGHKPAMRD